MGLKLSGIMFEVYGPGVEILRTVEKHMSYGLNSFKWVIGDYIVEYYTRAIKGDARSLDYSSYAEEHGRSKHGSSFLPPGLQSPCFP